MNAEPRYNDIYYKNTTFNSQIHDVVNNDTESLHNQTTPIDWEQLFGNKHPVEIEVGPGKGRFLLEASKQYPNINYVGVERAQKYVEITRLRFEKYIRHFSVDEKSGMFTNVRLVWTDANYFLTRYIPDASVQAYHVYFPDPWPKARQQKRRIFRNKDFLNAMTRTLTSDDGKLYFMTDYVEYYNEIQDRLRQHKALKPVLSDPQPYKNITTNFEMKYQSEGREIYRAVYTKV
ncbi:tRNA (guanosine(46)-N7)-methyltransferase TrmB [Candidatus Poribacteria bacterium]|nr:tRNA (guanosine(46)-N7)-methyltransferase TrmB [Candidatus Poribacteria bacterium]